MSVRKVSFVSGEYYHLYNRGNSKQKIFHDKEDHLHFLGLLYACNQKENLKVDNLRKGQNLFDIDRTSQLVHIGAYCLMPNHFHILVTQPKNGDISRFMQKLSTAYAMYYNKKYERTGGLFEGKFKSEHSGTDRYLKYLFAYIHLNPVKLIDSKWRTHGIRNKETAVGYLKQYVYSSFLDYLGIHRTQNKILDIRLFPRYFSTPKDFLAEIFEWLSYNEPELET